MASSTSAALDYFTIQKELTQLAREDFNAFVERVMRDERTGEYLEQAPVHQAWAELADEHDKLVLWSHVEAGKTTQMSIARPLWLLGRDPTARIAVVSNTHGQAKKIVGPIKQMIERSQDLHEVFPHLQPSEPWTDTTLTVKRPFVAKDPSIQALGLHGNITGARLDYLICDDILDWENTRTKDGRDSTWDWIQSTLIGRLTSRARVWIIGTAYHPDDALHRFAKMPGFRAFLYPMVDEKGEPRWPARWPRERVEKARKEWDPIVFARQALCKARSDEGSRFKSEWIEQCRRLGEGRKIGTGIQKIPAGCKTFTGVDLAVQVKDSADRTCMFTILVDGFGNRRVLECVSGKWPGEEICQRVASAQNRWQSIVIVENNGAQDYIRQRLGDKYGFPCHGFTTGSNKAHPEFGVESLAGEMAQGKWIIPCVNGFSTPELEEWISELLYYEPSKHTGDRLMASWFAREGIGMATRNQSSSFRLDIRSR
jgi:hypothetical protein